MDREGFFPLVTSNYNNLHVQDMSFAPSPSSSKFIFYTIGKDKIHLKQVYKAAVSFLTLHVNLFFLPNGVQIEWLLLRLLLLLLLLHRI